MQRKLIRINNLQPTKQPISIRTTRSPSKKQELDQSHQSRQQQQKSYCLNQRTTLNLTTPKYIKINHEDPNSKLQYLAQSYSLQDLGNEDQLKIFWELIDSQEVQWVRIYPEIYLKYAEHQTQTFVQIGDDQQAIQFNKPLAYYIGIWLDSMGYHDFNNKTRILNQVKNILDDNDYVLKIAECIYDTLLHQCLPCDLQRQALIKTCHEGWEYFIFLICKLINVFKQHWKQDTVLYQKLRFNAVDNSHSQLLILLIHQNMKTFSDLRRSFHSTSNMQQNQLPRSLNAQQRATEVQDIIFQLDNITKRKSLNTANDNPLKNMRKSCIIQTGWNQVNNLIKQEEDEDYVKVNQQLKVPMQGMNRKASFHIPLSYTLDTTNTSFNNSNIFNKPHQLDFQDPKDSKRTAASNKIPINQPRQTNKNFINRNSVKIQQAIKPELNKSTKPVKMISRVQRQNLSKQLKQLSEIILCTQIQAQSMPSILNALNQLKTQIRK